MAELSGADIDRLYFGGGAAPSAPPTDGQTAQPTGADIDAQFQAAAAAEAAAERAKVAAQPQTTTRGEARAVAAGVTDVGANYLNILNDPLGNLVLRPLAIAGGTVYDAGARLSGYPAMTPEQRADLYGQNDPPQVGTQIVDAAGKLIAGDKANVVPATPAEALTRKVVGGAGTAAAFGPLAAVPAALTMGGVGTVAGDEAAKHVPPWAQPGVELAGNIAGAKAAETGVSLGGKVANVATGAPGTPLVEAYKRSGVDPVLLGDVTQNPTAQLLQTYSGKSPGGASVVSPVEQKVVGQFHDSVERTAAGLGNSVDAQGAGTALQTEARTWKDTISAREQQAWAPVDNAMYGAVVDPSNYRTALTSLTGKLAALPETQKALMPPRVQQMLDAINADVPPGQTMPWQQAQQLRSAIGQIMGVPEVVQSVGKDQLKAAYGGISQDMKASANASGAGALFDSANAVSTAGHAFIDNTLSKIIRSNNPAQETVTPEGATKAILGGGDSTLQAVRSEMPLAANELAAFKLRNMMQATPGQAGPTGQETSVGSFLTNLNKLRQSAPNGTRALFNDPAVAQQVDDLANVGASMKDTAKRANTSNTASHSAVTEMLAGLVSGHLLSGGNYLATAAGTIAPLLANRALATAVTSPRTTNLLAAPGPRAMPSPLATALLASPEGQQMGRQYLQPNNR